MTPQQIYNLNDAIEGDVDLFDGYEDLDEQDKAKIAKAIEEGHVADEDWRGVRPLSHGNIL